MYVSRARARRHHQDQNAQKLNSWKSCLCINLMYPWVLQIDVVTKVLGLQLFQQGLSVELVTRACARAQTDTNSYKIWYENQKKLVDGSFESYDDLELEWTPINIF